MESRADIFVQTNGQTDKQTKIKCTFCDYTNAPKNGKGKLMHESRTRSSKIPNALRIRLNVAFLKVRYEKREWCNTKRRECQMCISENFPHLRVTMLIIVSNFALNHQVDYYRLEVPHLKLKPTLRQRGNYFWALPICTVHI
jgi:hypothetical protein